MKSRSRSVDNTPETCGKCHSGIFEKFKKSIHYTAKTDKALPLCNDCHSAHSISRTDGKGFNLDIVKTCGKCHEEGTESYFETYHGKVAQLGSAKTAKCHDCHGAHDILPPENLESRLSRKNIVETCAQCHPGSHKRFAGYLTHATHHDRQKYPILFFTFWFMVSLLVGTFAFFGIHTLLWFPRSFQTMRQRREHKHDLSKPQFQRFLPVQRWQHIFMIISFLGVAVTGMTLKFSYLPWAQWLSRLLGGFESAGFIHRVCAVVMIAVFVLHLILVLKRKRENKVGWMEFLLGKNSMIPNLNDLKDFIGTFKWFVGMGPRPNYGRWTYWEKFDYFGVFWGVSIIGISGLILWFPEFFTYFFPGWLINVATIIHSDEALLAVGFIFTIHFFNTHFRPDKFPMDTVIFTGTMPVEELEYDRPEEYKELVESGELEKHLVEPMPPQLVRLFKIFGAVALFIGLALILFIIGTAIFAYH